MISLLSFMMHNEYNEVLHRTKAMYHLDLIL